MRELDKREVSSVFRERLTRLIERRQENVSAFAARCGLDRSAMSQFLDPRSVRLPRAETLTAIAMTESVSIDWLLGISQDEETVGEVVSLLNIERGRPGTDDSQLTEWHREAAGYKIRYSPSSLPDLLLTKAVTDHQYRSRADRYVDVKLDQARQQLSYTRLPETDLEVVLPMQRLQNLALGVDIWDRLQRGVRQAQLQHMADLMEELYPTFRLFLYDGLVHHCTPFTVFGPKRAAVYIGDMYLVMNQVEHIREFTRHFDNLIREAEVGPDRVAEWVRALKVR